MLIARLAMGGCFIVWGVMKLRGGYAYLVPLLTRIGIPQAKALALLVGVCEVIGGVGVVLGYPLTTFSLLFALWFLLTALVTKRDDANQMLLHIGMCGGFIALATAGPGSLALFGGTPVGIWTVLP